MPSQNNVCKLYLLHDSGSAGLCPSDNIINILYCSTANQLLGYSCLQYVTNTHILPSHQGNCPTFPAHQNSLTFTNSPGCWKSRLCSKSQRWQRNSDSYQCLLDCIRSVGVLEVRQDAKLLCFLIAASLLFFDTRHWFNLELIREFFFRNMRLTTDGSGHRMLWISKRLLDHHLDLRWWYELELLNITHKSICQRTYTAFNITVNLPAESM